MLIKEPKNRNKSFVFFVFFFESKNKSNFKEEK